MVKIIFVTLLCVAAGYVLGGLLFEQTVAGAVFGLIAGFPLAKTLQTRLRRWATIAVLNSLIFFGFVIVWFQAMPQIAVMTTVLTIMAVGLSFFIAAAIQRDLYDGSEWAAFTTLLKLAIGVIRSYQIIEDGRTTVPPNATGPILGPRLVIVKPNNAVILEQGSRQTKISGPGFINTGPYEYVKSIYDLREHEESTQIDTVLTRDMLSTTARLNFTYAIGISTASRLGTRGKTPPPGTAVPAPAATSTPAPTAHANTLLPEETAFIQHINLTLPDWKKTTLNAVEMCLRQEVATMRLKHVVLPAARSRIADNTRYLANRMLADWGIMVHTVIIDEIRPSEPVMAVEEERWTARIHSDTVNTIEVGRAEAWGHALQLLAAAYRDAKRLGMPDVVIHGEAVRRTLEEIAKDPATKYILTPELGKEF